MISYKYNNHNVRFRARASMVSDLIVRFWQNRRPEFAV